VAFQKRATIDASAPFDIAYRGLAYYGLGKFQDAIHLAQSAGQLAEADVPSGSYDKLGRHSDSEAVRMMMKPKTAIGLLSVRR